MNKGQSLLLTGKAGTGKSFLLQFWKQQSPRKSVILASTGVAAINVEGQTIHSFFEIKPGSFIQEVQEKARKVSSKRLSLLRKLEVIILDEVSMVRADLLDCVNIYLQTALKSDYPFAGKQMLLIGDLYQLPPVVKQQEQAILADYKNAYFFSAKVFEEGRFLPEYVELQTVYRQKEDKDFIHLLNAIRNKSISEAELDILNKQVKDEPSEEDIAKSVFLTATNAKAQRINQAKLAEIQEEEKRYRAEVWGNLQAHAYPADEQLSLKLGARVMILKNDKGGGIIGKWVNGTTGVVVGFSKQKDEKGKSEEAVCVKKDEDGKVVDIFRTDWEVSRYQLKGGKIEREIIGEFRQFPLRLAWAITIHKSQGKTFPNIILDCSTGMFAHGQAYVALSRCTSLAGVCLTRPLTKDQIILDREIMHFLTSYQYRLAREKLPSQDLENILREAIENSSEVEIDYLHSNDVNQKFVALPISLLEQEIQGRLQLALEINQQGKKSFLNPLRILAARLVSGG